MKALAVFPAALLLALVARTPAVAAPADDPEQIIEDCSDSDLPPEVVDYCLHRVHRVNETSPTPDSTALEAQLQRRADELHRKDDSDATPGDRNDQNSSMDRRDDDRGYDDKGYDTQGYDDRGYDNDQPQKQPGADDDNDLPPQSDDDSSDDTSRDQPSQRPNDD